MTMVSNSTRPLQLVNRLPGEYRTKGRWMLTIFAYAGTGSGSPTFGVVLGAVVGIGFLVAVVVLIKQRRPK
jgi:hypothetical protein